LPQKEFGDWPHKEQIVAAPADSAATRVWRRSFDGSIVMYYWHRCWD
jgi:hypothetical protein